MASHIISLVFAGSTQGNTCYIGGDFGCQRTPQYEFVDVENPAEVCCDRGFLSYTIFGIDPCFQCTGKRFVLFGKLLG